MNQTQSKRAAASHYPDAESWDVFVRQKVERARVSLLADHGRLNDEVEAEFAARRESLGKVVKSLSSLC